MRILLVTLVPDDVVPGDVGGGAESALEPVLTELGCEVAPVHFGKVLAGEFPSGKPQVIVLEAGVRLETAYDGLSRLRERSELAHVPALLAVTTARLPSLRFGAADDFILLPVVPVELYARLRQLDWRTAAFAGDERIKLGELLIDLSGREVLLRERRLPLTHQEYELLKFLAQHPGRAFTREELLARVWGVRNRSRTVDIHVRRLRAKLGPSAERFIETVRHVGYKLRVE